MNNDNRKIEVENILKEFDMPTSDIENILSMISSDGNNNVESQDNSVDSIKLKLLDEQDWRKRAALSALIISKGLE